MGRLVQIAIFANHLTSRVMGICHGSATIHPGFVLPVTSWRHGRPALWPPTCIRTVNPDSISRRSGRTAFRYFAVRLGVCSLRIISEQIEPSDKENNYDFVAKAFWSAPPGLYVELWAHCQHP